MTLETEAVLDLMRQTAAEVITPRFRALADDDVFTKTHPGDLVTIADRESEEVITAALRAAYPDAMILGEEAAAADKSLLDAFATAEEAFTIDPIDGTWNFVHGKPDHAVMVAHLQAGQVVRSWIWQPEHELAFVAERGAGAYCNGERLTALTPAAQSAAWRGISSQEELRQGSYDGLATIDKTWFCAGVDYSHLVRGDIDYIVFWHANAWDHAPGQLLLSEVGGTIIRGDGSSYQPAVLKPWLIAAASAEVAEQVRLRVAADLIGPA